MPSAMKLLERTDHTSQRLRFCSLLLKVLLIKGYQGKHIAAIQDNVQSALIHSCAASHSFSLNFRRWLRFSGEGFLSMILALVSVMIIVATGYFIFRDKIPEGNKIAGMLIGCYTGGTVNMASLAIALGVEPNVFVMTNTMI